MESKNQAQFSLVYLVIVLILFFVINSIFSEQNVSPWISYDQFYSYLNKDLIEEAKVSEDKIVGTYKQEMNGSKNFSTMRVDKELATDLLDHGVKVTGTSSDSSIGAVFSWIIPTLIFFGIWMFILNRLTSKGGLGGGFMKVGKSKAKVYVETDTKVTFRDVAGVDEAIVELKEIVHFLKEPKKYGRLGAKVPKGVLLVGPPGTGKTLLARAVAGEAAVPFFTISGSEFVEMFVGVGAARVRDLFEQARAKAPCIIFIDELDALGKARSANPMSGGHDEKEQTLNQLLVELDGFDPSSGIVLLAASNRPEILDPALLRAGRFDRQILVDRPDREGRAQILKIHTQKLKLADDVNLEKIASLTPGFTGADLGNLANEAALIATRKNAESIELKDFTNAMERIIAGLQKKNRLLNPRERQVVAYHEMGHAIVSAAIPGSDKVHKISIIPRGIGSLGYTINRPTEDRFLMTKEELQNKMAILLGGRASEFLIFKQLSSGAADDIGKATEIARTIVTQYGMEERLGHATYESAQNSFLGETSIKPRVYSEETAREIDCAVKTLVNNAFDQASQILKDNQNILHDSAKLLLERESLSEEDFTPFFKEVRKLANVQASKGIVNI